MEKTNVTGYGLYLERKGSASMRAETVASGGTLYRGLRG